MLGSENPAVKFIVCCTRYLIDCLNRCIKFITKNAYIQVAIRNKSFCPGAWAAFLLILSNAGRFAVMTSIGAVFMILGKLTLISATVLTGYVIIDNVEDIKDNLYSPLLPLILYGVIAYVITSSFLAVYSFSSDVILQCFLLDEELAQMDGHREGKNRPPSLQKFAKAENGKSCGCCC